MSPWTRLPMLALAAFLCLPAPRAEARLAAAAALQDAFAEVAETARPAVVSIRTTQERSLAAPHEFFFHPQDFFEDRPGRGRTFRAHGVGSGVIVRPEGLVLTNEHVVRDADEIEVVLTPAGGKQETLKGRVVGTDPGLDLAVVRIEKNGIYPYLKLGDTDRLRVGDWAIAIGSPFELQQTVTVGVVSALRQSLMIEGRRYPNMIQTDAAINRGNSGGPLLNLDGEVIGINTAIFSPSGAFSGIGFSVPAGEIKPVLDLLLAGKKIKRGWLGIRIRPVDEVIRKRFSLESRKGALVNRVFDGSPAERAGLRRGDVIVSFDGSPVDGPDDLVNRAQRTPPDRAVAVRVVRKGRVKTLRLTLASKPEWAERGEAPGTRREAGRPGRRVWQGIEVGPADQGVRVLDVDPDSKLAGTLEPGDVIQGINQDPVDGVPSFGRAVKGVRLREGVVFDVLRAGQPMYISVQQ